MKSVEATVIEVYQSHIYLQFFSQRCLNGYIDSFIYNLKKIKQNKGKQTKVEDVAVEFIMVSADNLLLKETFLGSRSY